MFCGCDPNENDRIQNYPHISNVIMKVGSLADFFGDVEINDNSHFCDFRSLFSNGKLFISHYCLLNYKRESLWNYLYVQFDNKFCFFYDGFGLNISNEPRDWKEELDRLYQEKVFPLFGN